MALHGKKGFMWTVYSPPPKKRWLGLPKRHLAPSKTCLWVRPCSRVNPRIRRFTGGLCLSVFRKDRYIKFWDGRIRRMRTADNTSLSRQNTQWSVFKYALCHPRRGRWYFTGIEAFQHGSYQQIFALTCFAKLFSPWSWLVGWLVGWLLYDDCASAERRLAIYTAGDQPQGGVWSWLRRQRLLTSYVTWPLWPLPGGSPPIWPLLAQWIGWVNFGHERDFYKMTVI